jgi:1-acyl-sn-glycerol-3-phosphate acyltransferase
MIMKLNYLWRLIGTAVAFTTFSLGGLVLAVFVFPVISLLSSRQETRRRRVQGIVRYGFRAFLQLMQVWGIMRLECINKERLATSSGRLIISNHPTLIDVVVLMSLTPQAQCIIKREVWDHRFFGGVARIAGYIRNDEDPEELITKCQAAIANGDNIIIFPEGTRTVPGQEVRLRRGFANIAAFTAADMQLVLINCEPATLAKEIPWYNIPDRRFHLRVSVENIVPISGYLQQHERSIAVRRLTKDLETYFNGESDITFPGSRNKIVDY